MGKYQILTLVGGISRDSINQKLFRQFEKISAGRLELINFDISLLPFFSQDLELDPPDSVVQFKEEIRECDGVLFITPEYNRSLPGVLKNAIDWGSRPYGQNLWDKKPAGLMGASIGNIGTFGSQQHLRQVLSYLNVMAMSKPEFYLNASTVFNDKGDLIDEKTKSIMNTFLKSYEAWLERFATRRSMGMEDSPYAH